MMRYRSIGLFATVITFFLLSPLLSRGIHLEISVSLLFSFVIGFFGYRLSPTRFWLTGVTSLSLLALIVFLAKTVFPTNVPLGVLYQVALLGLLLLTLSLCLRYALFAQQPRPFDRVIAGVSGYFIIALIWAAMYAGFLEYDSDAILDQGRAIGTTSSSIFYYSLITLTTQGYGEIVPANPYVRILAGMEGAFGSIYLAVLIAVLVSEVRRERASAK